MPIDAWDMVKHDQAWKDHVRAEVKVTDKVWPSRWGFLVTEYWQLHEDRTHTQVSENAKHREKIKASDHRHKLPPVKGASNKRYSDGAPARFKGLYPETTAQVIGWHSTDPRRKLEIYGPYCRHIRDAWKAFGWPPGIDM